MGSADSGRLDGMRFSVVGEQVNGSRAVRHVGILQASVSVQIGDPVEVFHMGPPIVVGQAPELREPRYVEHMAAHVLAWLDDLSGEQVMRIEQWLEGVRVQLRNGVRFRYRVLPAYEEELNEDRTMVRYRRFSCSGFVERCYRDGAGISLIVQEERLPEVELDLIRRVWGPAGELPPQVLDRVRRTMAEWGLKGSGPWRVLLPGYLLHAMSCAAETVLPYEPKVTDCEF